ncbi:MAG: transporter, partial [Fibrella sp.]|nr:transporter [Armatimonadota bacterium]
MSVIYRVSASALAILCLGLPVFAQGKLPPEPGSDPRADPLVTDRPDFTESALTIPRGLSQAEFGATFAESGGDDENGFGELLMRIGLNKRTELRLGIPTYLSTRAAASGRSSGFADASLGFKFSLASAGDRLGLRQFDVGLIVATTLPTGSSAYRERKLQPGAKLL